MGLREPVDEPTTREWSQVKEDGLKPVTVEEAAQQAQFIQILIPDDIQARFTRSHQPYLEEGDVLGFSTDLTYIMDR